MEKLTQKYILAGLETYTIPTIRTITTTYTVITITNHVLPTHTYHIYQSMRALMVLNTNRQANTFTTIFKIFNNKAYIFTTISLTAIFHTFHKNKHLLTIVI